MTDSKVTFSDNGLAGFYLKNSSLEKLVNVLQKQKELRRDIIAPSSKLTFTHEGKLMIEKGLSDSSFSAAMNDLGLQADLKADYFIEPSEEMIGQLCDKLLGSRNYMKKCFKNNRKDIFFDNLNFWLKHEVENTDKPRSFLIRTFLDENEPDSGNGRAFLSNRFLMIENLSILTTTLQSIKDEAEKSDLNIRVAECGLTNKKMYVKFYCPDVECSSWILDNYRVPENKEIATENDLGGGIYSGFALTNSETGFGQFSIAPMLIVGACRNKQIWKKEGLNKKHLGAAMDDSVVVWSNETMRKNLELIRSQVKDSVRKFISPEYLGKKVSEIEAAASIELDNPIEATKYICDDIGLNTDDLNSVLGYFSKQGGGKNVWDVCQAITFHAQHNLSTDDSYNVECKIPEILDKAKVYASLSGE